MNTPNWTCVVCAAVTGIELRDWALALHPICIDCGIYLSGDRAGQVTAADRPLIGLVARLVRLAEGSSTSHKSRAALRRLYRLSALVAQTIDDEWPVCTSEADSQPRVLAGAKSWGRSPPQHPQTVATVLRSAAAALGSYSIETALVREGWARLARQRRAGGSARGCPPTYLPKPPKARPATAAALMPGFTTEDSQRLRWLDRRLRLLADRHGLRPDHVPAIAILPGEDTLPAANEWYERGETAIVLHMMINGCHGRPVSAASASHAFGTARENTSRLVDGIALRRGIGTDHADRLLAFAEHLCADGLIDYQYRRDMLRPHRRLGCRMRRHLRLPQVDGWESDALAAGWIWVQLTRGLMCTSGTPKVSTLTVLAFGDLLDPEIRLALFDHGEQLLADAELIDVSAPVGRTVRSSRLG